MSVPASACRLLDSPPRTRSQKTLKCEEVYVHQYQTFEEAHARLQTFLEDVSHAKRLHSSLDYVPPDEFELNYSLCSCLGGLDFLEALHSVNRLLCCQLTTSHV